MKRDEDGAAVKILQRSKLKRILGTARVTRSFETNTKLIKYADVAELAASSPKRSRWEIQRGEDGAAVKILQRPKLKRILGTARVTRLFETNTKLIKYADVAELADALDSGSSES